MTLCVRLQQVLYKALAKIGHQINTIKLYKTNFTERGKKIVLSLHCNGDNSYLFINGVEQPKFK